MVDSEISKEVTMINKSFLLARSNMRKAKGQTTALFVLIFLAALSLNLWLMLSLDYKQNFIRSHDRLNAEHVALVADGDETEIKRFLTQTLERDARTDTFSIVPSMHMVGLFAFNGGEINSEFILLEKQTALSRSVGKVEIVEEGSIESGIYMPILYKSEEIQIGKTIEITIGSKPLTYKVCGFFNSIMAGSHNCSICELILTQDKYRELEQSGYAPKSALCSVRISDKSESESYEAMLKNAIASRYPASRTASTSYALVIKSRYISQMICSGVMSAMAFLILLIALVVIASNIINYIQENIKNLGSLKAIGYTSRQLVFSLFVQFCGVSTAATILGAAASYCLFPFVNTMMAAQTGIPYTVRFLPLPLLLTFLILNGTVALVVWLSSRRIKRTEPIVALRSGIETHNFKRNHIPLDKTKAPLSMALSLKTTCSNRKQNIIICITMYVLSLVVVFSGLMVRNIIIDMTPFLNLIVGETTYSCININADIEQEFLETMHSHPSVEKVYLFHTVEVRHVDGTVLLATLSNDFATINNQNIVFEGRFPKYDNEIAIAAKYAREHDLQIGNEIQITANGKKAVYLISGFTQITNNLGKDCLLTRAGYERLGRLQNTSYYLNLTATTDIEAFHNTVKERFGSDVNATINVAATVEGGGSVYVSLMTIIVIAILILSAIVITFVLYLLVRTVVSHKKQDYGIMKALGFTTGQLILQTSLSFMPAVIFSTITGITICSFIINPLIALFLNSIGIVKCTFKIPLGFMISADIALILFAFVTACLLSMKIKKITPKALLTGE